MYRNTIDIQKGFGQPHVLGAMRRFAEQQNLSDVADRAGMKSAQILRNKLLPNQPHQMTIHELVSVSRASGNRCLVDGILMELQCAPSVALKQLTDANKTSLTDRALEITANTGQLSSIALDAKTRRGVTERMRHEAVQRASSAMSELAVFCYEIEKHCLSSMLSIATSSLPSEQQQSVLS